MKKLYKNKETGIASGIFSGIGEWMEVTPGILRFGYVVLAVITGILPAIFLYALAHFLISEKR
ncbi:MAG: PspC domain-containing protein [bacterium]|nr:PspC domain-containing protein [bacterium]